MRCIPFFALLLALSLLSACANIVPPSGGPADRTPPQLLNIQPQDSLRNTRINKIVLKFDEYVNIADVAKELQISPMLKNAPSMTAAGKTVTIKIQDSLLSDNTTYTINIGHAVKDVHEGNSYSGTTYIFSTGAWFDSLQVKGKIIDAASGKIDSSGNVRVLLYDAANDINIVSLQKPVYVCTSDKKGNFIFKGIPNKAFRIYALKENNGNLIFDKEDEYIGFSAKTVLPALDTAGITLSIFKEKTDSSKSKTANNTEQSDDKFDRKPKATSSQTLDAKTFNYKALVDTSNKNKGSQELNQALAIQFSRSLTQYDVQKILLTADSNEIEVQCKYNFILDSSKKKLSLQNQWMPNTNYTLRLIKNFASDSSLSNLMPCKYYFKTKAEEDYGTLDIIVPERYVANNNYLLQIMLNDKVIYLAPINQQNKTIKYLSEGIYQLSIVTDVNHDGTWTSGQLKTEQQAEPVLPFPDAVLMKAGWEHVVDFEPKKNK
jgi:hypothetical protein